VALPVRKSPKRFFDGLHQTRLSDALLADHDQLDGAVDDRVFLQRAQILAHVGRAFWEVGRDVDERVAGERDAAQSTQS